MKRLVQGTSLERAELERLRARVGRLFAALQEAAEMAALDAPGAWLPPVDVCESEGAVTVLVELPGVRASDVEVRVAGGELRVGGRKRKGAPRGVISHLCSERSYGHFTRAVPLRWPIRAEEATAELRDGLLTVRLPKLMERRGAEYKIEVTGDK
ncbi:MAG: Hsp20/alpha crystallin family protein [Acidobacteriota bacterium]|nr:Hsp20/alpha crystallin family protein [Acidobacteriota bacterium]